MVTWDHHDTRGTHGTTMVTWDHHDVNGTHGTTTVTWDHQGMGTGPQGTPQQAGTPTAPMGPPR